MNTGNGAMQLDEAQEMRADIAVLKQRFQRLDDADVARTGELRELGGRIRNTHDVATDALTEIHTVRTEGRETRDLCRSILQTLEVLVHKAPKRKPRRKK